VEPALRAFAQIQSSQIGCGKLLLCKNAAKSLIHRCFTLDPQLCFNDMKISLGFLLTSLAMSLYCAFPVLHRRRERTRK
jgi:hypothetical protein